MWMRNWYDRTKSDPFFSGPFHSKEKIEEETKKHSIGRIWPKLACAMQSDYGVTKPKTDKLMDKI